MHGMMVESQAKKTVWTDARARWIQLKATGAQHVTWVCHKTRLKLCRQAGIKIQEICDALRGLEFVMEASEQKSPGCIWF